MVSGVFSIPLDASKASSTSSNGHAQPRLPLPEFISGNENGLARVAAEALLRDDLTYNPIVVHGDTGTGKSHLCLGLVERWKQERPRAKSLVVAASDFARGYGSAIDADALDDFRRKYRRLDLLLIENLSELAGKEGAQRELSATLDELVHRGRHVLATSTKLPAQIDHLAPSLAGRLSAGLLVPLTRPGPQARKLLLERLAAAHHVALTAEALDTLAQRLEATVPELNHTIVTLAAQAGNAIGSELGNGVPQVDSGLVARYLAADGNTTVAPTLRIITTRVARYFRLRSADLKGPTRRQAVVQARGVAMYLARQLTGKSLDEVGRHYGGRDHTTVLHACRKTESLLTDDVATRQAIDELRTQLSK